MSEEEIKFRRYNNINGIKEEIYWLGWKLHNPDGPAYRRWSVDGQLIRESYWINDKSHREDGPALKRWDKNIYYELNFINNKLTRINGYGFRLYCNNELVYQI